MDGKDKIVMALLATMMASLSASIVVQLATLSALSKVEVGAELKKPQQPSGPVCVPNKFYLPNLNKTVSAVICNPTEAQRVFDCVSKIVVNGTVVSDECANLLKADASIQRAS
ncbi:MAG: hypothetical protein GXO07_03325 [Crenarchaeota archaeon]|nr:hypothetical protein [Thermoproteota archaeon]